MNYQDFLSTKIVEREASGFSVSSENINYDFNADELIKQKLEKNSQKYPVSDSKDKWN